MEEMTITINNETGLHARPASDFVAFTKTFDNKINLMKGDKALNAKSILHVLSLALKKGDSVTVRADGDNAKEVLEKIAKFAEELEG